MQEPLYLDVCCLNRSIGNQTQEPISLEAQTIPLILANWSRTEDLIILCRLM
ncbi:hypothetical protein H6G93_20385 [Nostoc sp. FACHB-973]|nr:hypothetical protein [Nostoc sp. FACHB-973]MBX9252885.1 hypothetical protein [Desmonostoc muscorum CCALA 125]